MTGEEFKAIRQGLGLSHGELADVLGYACSSTVAQFETKGPSRKAVRQVLARLMRAYEAGYRPKDWPEVQDGHG